VLEDVENFDSSCVSSLTEAASNDFLIFPNPADDFIYFDNETFSSNSHNERFEIFDATGRKIFSTTQNLVSLLGLQGGLYFVQRGKVVKAFLKK
jgi:hypothetical protein